MTMLSMALGAVKEATSALPTGADATGLGDPLSLGAAARGVIFKVRVPPLEPSPLEQFTRGRLVRICTG